MYHIQIKDLSYKYVVGSVSVGIVTPGRKKHVISIQTITQNTDHLAINPCSGEGAGTADTRVSPRQIAEYIITNKLA